MKVHPTPLPSGYYLRLITLKFPNYGTFSSGSNNVGIYWKNPSDHTQAFGLSDGFDFANGFNFSSLDMLDFNSQGGRGVINSPPHPAINLYSVNAAGADVALIGQAFANFNGIQSDFALFGIGASAGTTPFNGIRMEIDFGAIGAGGSCSIVVPQVINCYGA